MFMGLVGIRLNSWDWESPGIPGIGNSQPFSGHCTTQSGNGNSWERELPGIPTPGLAFPRKSAAIASLNDTRCHVHSEHSGICTFRCVSFCALLFVVWFLLKSVGFRTPLHREKLAPAFFVRVKFVVV